MIMYITLNLMCVPCLKIYLLCKDIEFNLLIYGATTDENREVTYSPHDGSIHSMN